MPSDPRMQSRLAANRQGKLSREQYRELVMEPVTIALLLLPGLIILRSQTLLPGGWMFGLAGLGLLGLWILRRALRYRRARVQVMTLRAEKSTGGLWRSVALYDDVGQVKQFVRSLAPRFTLERGRVYEVYYFVDAGRNILLSVAERF